MFIGAVNSSRNEAPEELEEEIVDTEPIALPNAVPQSPRVATPSSPPRAQKIFDFEGKVVKVVDGDTITILTAGKDQVKIRLEAIDAPEASQEYGAASKEALAALVAGKAVGVNKSGQDRYGRILAWVEVDGVDVNRRMVRDGWAWHFVKYNKDAGIALLQEEAKAAHRGLWQATTPPTAPWSYRSFGPDVPAAPAQPLPLALSALPAAAPAPTPPNSAKTAPKPATAFLKTDPAPRQNPSNRKYWINTYNGVRHNSRCRWFETTQQGHYGEANEGTPCGKCGG